MEFPTRELSVSINHQKKLYIVCSHNLMTFETKLLKSLTNLNPIRINNYYLLFTYVKSCYCMLIAV